MQIDMPCTSDGNITSNKEYHEIVANVKVPAKQTVRLQLKMNGDLPLCFSSTHASKSTDTDYKTTPHPVQICIDNITISEGANSVVSMSKTDTYQLDLDILDTDTVKYCTNSYLSDWTHTDTATECSRFNPDVATVDENGLITANEVGETCLIATISHSDGSVERKQCIVRVTE